MERKRDFILLDLRDEKSCSCYAIPGLECYANTGKLTFCSPVLPLPDLLACHLLFEQSCSTATLQIKPFCICEMLSFKTVKAKVLLNCDVC